eukprot:s135_g18.t2
MGHGDKEQDPDFPYSAGQDPLRCAIVEFFKHRPFEPSFPQPTRNWLGVSHRNMQIWNKHDANGKHMYFWSKYSWSDSCKLPCGFVRCRSCPATANAAAWCGSSNHVNWVLWHSLAWHSAIHMLPG